MGRSILTPSWSLSDKEHHRMSYHYLRYKPFEYSQKWNGTEVWDQFEINCPDTCTCEKGNMALVHFCIRSIDVPDIQRPRGLRLLISDFTNSCLASSEFPHYSLDRWTCLASSHGSALERVVHSHYKLLDAMSEHFIPHDYKTLGFSSVGQYSHSSLPTRFWIWVKRFWTNWLNCFMTP